MSKPEILLYTCDGGKDVTKHKWWELIRSVTRFAATWLIPPPATPIQPPSSEKSKSEIFYDAQVRRLQAQSQSVDALSAKITTWATIPSLVITFLATILATERPNLSSHAEWLIRISFGSYLLSLLVLYCAHRPFKWLDGPAWDQLAGSVGDANQDTNDMLYGIAYHLGVNTLPTNRKRLFWRQILLDTGAAFALISIALLIAVVLFNLHNPSSTISLAVPISRTQQLTNPTVRPSEVVVRLVAPQARPC